MELLFGACHARVIADRNYSDLRSGMTSVVLLPPESTFYNPLFYQRVTIRRGEILHQNDHERHYTSQLDLDFAFCFGVNRSIC